MKGGDLVTVTGQPTGAVHGFMSMLANLMQEYEPEFLGVAFDRPEPTFRHDTISTYKANRKKPERDFLRQLVLLKELLAVCGIKTVEVPGVEADDVLASYATKGVEEKLEVLIVSGDRDIFQLVQDPNVKVIYPERRVGSHMVMDESAVLQKTGVLPRQYVDYAALRGDTSDNLPGVSGIGEKIAAKLINAHGGVEEILKVAQDSEELPDKQRKALMNSQELVKTNRQVMELLREVELPYSLTKLRLAKPEIEPLREKLKELEFSGLGKRLADALQLPREEFAEELLEQGELLETKVKVYIKPAEAVAMLRGLSSRFTFDDPLCVGVALGVAEKKPGRPRDVQGMALVCDKEAGEVAWLPQEVFQSEETLEALRELFGGMGDKKSSGAIQKSSGAAHESRVPLAGHDTKSWMRQLLKLGVDTPNLVMDTHLASQLLDTGQIPLKRLIRLHTDKRLGASLSSSPQSDTQFDTQINPKTSLNAKPVKSDPQLSINATTQPDSDPADDPSGDTLNDSASEPTGIAATIAGEVLAVAWLCQPLRTKIIKEGMQEIFQQAEIPLAPLLARMEHRGIGVDKKELKTLRDSLKSKVGKLHDAVTTAAGKKFNPKSPKQVQEVLYEDLGLQPQKRTKRGYSTDAKSLLSLQGQHEIVDLLIQYREVDKLYSTYGDGLLDEVGEDSRIHATFNQLGARTGRLSSESPNLHNIPVRTELGRQFRRAFTAREDSCLIVADYDQIELRCIAHLSADEELLKAFTDGIDVHSYVASQVFEVPTQEVTSAQRNRAKAVSYGLAYGMEAFGLAQRLGIENSEAQEILDEYFGVFKGVARYMADSVADAREKGYTQTLMGRRRSIADLSPTAPAALRQAAERQAMNSAIQGLAADIFKLALIEVDRQLDGTVADIVLQVHDEIILEVPQASKGEFESKVCDAMSGVYELSVPLVVSVASGKTWADAKS